MIYYLEDDKNIRELVVYTLKMAGLDVIGYPNANVFWKAVKESIPELILLDIMLPDADGIDILKRLRQNQTYVNIPVIMVTAKGAEYDKVVGLDLGADDYISKPFAMMEFVSRVKAVLRRTGAKANITQLIASGVYLDAEKHTVTANGDEVILTLKEFELLKMLIENQGFVLTRDKLLNQIWGYDFDGETRTVDVHIRSLRLKLGSCGDIIETIRGVGYKVSTGK
ncbi:MAG: DNA-binding response regulator [Clostridiales bacterium GWF2_38_85]|nr:MAG: DNA-binding response regulator [Clostridiales bacterium GWF2_38_85]HBL83926.1 DNA-binding response regulator [Clostridiales bacterium]